MKEKKKLEEFPWTAQLDNERSKNSQRSQIMQKIVGISKHLNRTKDKRASGFFPSISKEGGSYENILLKTLSSMNDVQHAALNKEEETLVKTIVNSLNQSSKSVQNAFDDYSVKLENSHLTASYFKEPKGEIKSSERGLKTKEGILMIQDSEIKKLVKKKANEGDILNRKQNYDHYASQYSNDGAELIKIYTEDNTKPYIYQRLVSDLKYFQKYLEIYQKAVSDILSGCSNVPIQNMSIGSEKAPVSNLLRNKGGPSEAKMISSEKRSSGNPLEDPNPIFNPQTQYPQITRKNSLRKSVTGDRRNVDSIIEVENENDFMPSKNNDQTVSVLWTDKTTDGLSVYVGERVIKLSVSPNGMARVRKLDGTEGYINETYLGS